MTSFNQTAQFYNRSLWFYELILYFFFNKARRKVAKRVNQLGGTVLELGCHQGQFAQLLDPTIEYLGIDIAEKAIEKAQNKSRSIHHQFEYINAISLLNDKKQFKNYALLYFLSVCDNPDQVIILISNNSQKGDRMFIVNHFSKS